MPTEIADGGEVKGVFGFPYNRSWKDVSRDLTELKASRGYSTYNSNEKYRVTKYYFRDFKWQDEASDVYIWVNKPQSLVDVEKPGNMIIKEAKNYIIIANHD